MVRLLTFLFLIVLACAACGLMSPAQQQTALAVVDEMLRNGSITAAQWEAMREAILAASSANWWSVAAQTVLGGALGYVGVQMRRGPVATPDERVARRTVVKPR